MALALHQASVAPSLVHMPRSLFCSRRPAASRGVQFIELHLYRLVHLLRAHARSVASHSAPPPAPRPPAHAGSVLTRKQTKRHKKHPSDRQKYHTKYQIYL